MVTLIHSFRKQSQTGLKIDITKNNFELRIFGRILSINFDKILLLSTMRLLRITLFSLCCLVFIKNGDTQDIHFSQFNNSPLSLNPAETGNFKGDWRISGNFRRQWATITSPFLTNSLGFEKQLYLGNEDMALGLYINYDQSGDLKFTGNKIYLSFAYAKKIKKHRIRVAVQPGFISKTYGTEKLTYPDQFNYGTGYFDNGIATSDPLSGTQLAYGDLNLGGLWTFDGKKIKPEAGFSLFHILNTKESFDNNLEVLPLRSQWNAASYFYLGEKYFIYPYVQYMFQGKASSSLSGVNFGIRFRENNMRIKHFYVGHIFRSGFNRISDALIPTAGLRIQNFDIGASYDINMSSLKSATQGRGALELSLIYTHKTNFLKKSTPPCDRM